MKIQNILSFLAFICLTGFFLTACMDKPCREIQAEKAAAKGAAAKAAGDGVVAETPAVAVGAPLIGASQLKVKVYKADGTLQCGMGSKIALETMEKDLKGIKVFSRVNKNDGLMRIQVCGAPTGGSNVYEISQVDLQKALKAGFKEWTGE